MTTSEKPFISVMVLCYNCEKLVDKALNAIANQTFRDFELLFIDNGSTDGSRNVFLEFAAQHPALSARCITIPENQGPTHGWNEGLKESCGEYLLFNDADDWMDEDCLSALAAKAKETGADRITGQYREVSIDGKALRERVIVSEKSKRLPTAMLQGTLFRKKVFEENGIRFPEGHNTVAYDFEVVYRFALYESHPGEIVRKTVYNYLVHSGSVIQASASADKAFEYLDAVTGPLIRMTGQVAGACADRDLAERMIYLVIRNYYTRILSLYQKIDPKTASDITKGMRSCMESALPGYKNNHYLKPFRNGYEQPGSFSVWVLSVFERLHLLEGVSRLISARIRRTKFFR